MATQPSAAQRALVAKETRKRFLAELARSMTELGGAVYERLTNLLDEAAPSREMQDRRDAWTVYRERRQAWMEGTVSDWEAAAAPAPASHAKPLELQLELVGTDTVENRIVASRLAQGLLEVVKDELDDLRLRMKKVEGETLVEQRDVLEPEVLSLVMVERWADVGLPRAAWPMITEVVQKHLGQSLVKAYASCNTFLIAQGVLPTIDLAHRVKRAAPARGRSAGAGAPQPGFAETIDGSEFRNTSGRQSLQQEGGRPGPGPGRGRDLDLDLDRGVLLRVAGGQTTRPGPAGILVDRPTVNLPEAPVRRRDRAMAARLTRKRA